MKRGVLSALALCLLLGGCQGDFLPYARDIEMIELLRTLGVDAGTEGRVLVTVSGGVQRTGDNGQGERPALFSQEGRTIYDACSTIQTFSDRYVFFGHVSEWVLGEAAARQGVSGLVDFMERDVQMRLNTKVFVVKDGRAEEVLRHTATERAAATDRLAAIELDYQLKSVAYPYTVKELLNQLEENGCGLIPALVLEREEGEEPADGQQEEATMTLNSVGCGYLKEDRLVGFLDAGQSRGANLLLNQAATGTVEVPLPGGAVAALRLVKSRCRWELSEEEGALTGMTARLEVEADLAELRGQVDLAEPELLAVMRRGLEEQLRKETEGVLALSRREEADFLHLRRTAAIQRPWRAAALEEHWGTWFPALRLETQVKGTVRRSYDISEPMGRGGAEERG